MAAMSGPAACSCPLQPLAAAADELSWCQLTLLLVLLGNFSWILGCLVVRCLKGAQLPENHQDQGKDSVPGMSIKLRTLKDRIAELENELKQERLQSAATFDKSDRSFEKRWYHLLGMQKSFAMSSDVYLMPHGSVWHTSAACATRTTGTRKEKNKPEVRRCCQICGPNIVTDAYNG